VTVDRRTIIIIVLAVVAAGAVAAVFVVRARSSNGDTSATPVASVAPLASAPASADPAPIPSSTPTTPPPADMDGMAEPAAATAVDDAVTEAEAATAATDQEAQSAADDGELSVEEAAALAAMTAQAEALVQYAEDTAAAYEDVYAAASGDLAGELDELESELATLSSDLEAVLVYLEKGEAAAEQVAGKLSDAATSAGQLQQAAADWSSSLAGLCEQRAEQAAATQAMQVSDTRMGAIQSLKYYVETVKGAVSGGLSGQEIGRVSQAGANAAASLQAAGGALAGLSGQVQTLTRQLAGGDLPGVRQGISQLEQAVP
jgi:hypothetical protein